MAAYIVSCEFQANADQHSRLSERLAAFGEFRQLNSAMWLLNTRDDAVDMLEGLSDCIAVDDKLLIARLQGDAALEGYSPPLAEWVQGTLLYESC